MDTPTAGFWEGLGPAASVDWCEPNYALSYYIAEFWNTLSSLPIAILGFAGAYLATRAVRQGRIGAAEPRFFWGFISLGIVGLGSAAFHGTILKYPQASDELPMMYCGLIFLYILRFNRSPARPVGNLPDTMTRWRWALAVYAVVFTLMYFALPFYFQFFVLSYGAIVAYLAVRSWRIVYRDHSSSTLKRLFAASVVCYVGGFTVLWLPEHVFLACDHPLQGLQLHSVFHLTSGVGSYGWLLLVLFDRQLSLGGSPKVGGRFPFVFTP